MNVLLTTSKYKRRDNLYGKSLLVVFLISEQEETYLREEDLLHLSEIEFDCSFL